MGYGLQLCTAQVQSTRSHSFQRVCNRGVLCYRLDSTYLWLFHYLYGVMGVEWHCLRTLQFINCKPVWRFVSALTQKYLYLHKDSPIIVSQQFGIEQIEVVILHKECEFRIRFLKLCFVFKERRKVVSPTFLDTIKI